MKKGKKVAVIGLAVIIGLLTASGVYAWWGGYGMGYGTGTNSETMKKFQKETLSLRDDIITKKLELQEEYSKPDPDSDRIAALRKEIIDIQAKIQKSADKYGISGKGPRGRHMGGMMGGRGMMGNAMGMCSCDMCGW